MAKSAWLGKKAPLQNAEFEMRRCPFCLVKPKTENICRAIVSPWIREMGVTKRRVCRYLICEDCDLGWFSLRYSDKGLENLYKNYRSKSYTAIRNKWESWYDERYNQSHEDPHWIKSRAEAISDFFRGKVDVSSSEVVDIGGDTGQIAELLGAKSFRVVEISDRALSQETQSQSLPSIAVLAHVLEHVSSPKEFIANRLNNYNSVYVEVSYGLPAITPGRRSLLRLLLGLLASLFPQTWKPFSNPSTGRKHPAELLRVSEHLTFFVESTFEKLSIEDSAVSHLVSCSTREIISPDKNSSVQIIQVLWKNL
jgi:hypothetical protein